MRARDPLRGGTTAAEVDAILATLPADLRGALEHLRGVIAATAPEVVESVAYGVPAFKYRAPRR